MVLSSLLELLLDGVQGVQHLLKGPGKSDVEPIALVEQPARDNNREAEASNELRYGYKVQNCPLACPRLNDLDLVQCLSTPFSLSCRGPS